MSAAVRSGPMQPTAVQRSLQPATALVLSAYQEPLVMSNAVRYGSGPRKPLVIEKMATVAATPAECFALAKDFDRHDSLGITPMLRKCTADWCNDTTALVNYELEFAKIHLCYSALFALRPEFHRLDWVCDRALQGVTGEFEFTPVANGGQSVLSPNTLARFRLEIDLGRLRLCSSVDRPLVGRLVGQSLTGFKRVAEDKSKLNQ